MDTALVELIEFLKNVAPEVWRILMRQVLVEVAQNVFAIVVCVVVFLVFWKSAVEQIEKARKDFMDTEPFTMVFSWAAVLMSAIVFVISVSNLIGRVINPEFYALQYLFNQLP